ncbi:zinc finger protein 140-like isoform 6-T7 [Sarcophilus harrisii]
MEDLTQMIGERALPSQDENSPDEDMAAVVLPAGPQQSMAFKNVAVAFGQEEWSQLDPTQKDVYRDVILEKYRHLVSMGLPISKPDVISQLERKEDPWMLEREVSRDVYSVISDFTWIMTQVGWTRASQRAPCEELDRETLAVP